MTLLNNYPEPPRWREVQAARRPRRPPQRVQVQEQEQEQDQLEVGGGERAEPEVRLRQG